MRSVYSPPEECGEIDGIFGPDVGPVCTLARGHDGDHVAIDLSTDKEVSRWPNELPPPRDHGTAVPEPEAASRERQTDDRGPGGER
jgi:hypothetical protein